jgi:hypothetical protein
LRQEPPFDPDFGLSSEAAPNDAYAWRWTIDTILDAQKKASRWNATCPTTTPPSWSFADREAERDPSPFLFGGT